MIKYLSTRATIHYLGIYCDIIDNFENEEMYKELEHLDLLAEKCLTFAEFCDYTKKTRNYLEKITK